MASPAAATVAPTVEAPWQSLIKVPLSGAGNSLHAQSYAQELAWAVPLQVPVS